MKPLAGGAIEDGTLALRYVCSNPDVTVVIPGMAEIRELDENMAACSDSTPLTEEELKKMEEVRARLGNDFCRQLQLLCTMYRRYQYPKCISLCRLSAEI